MIKSLRVRLNLLEEVILPLPPRKWSNILGEVGDDTGDRFLIAVARFLNSCHSFMLHLGAHNGFGVRWVKPHEVFRIQFIINLHSTDFVLGQKCVPTPVKKYRVALT
jgi:hypothetical protein